MLPLEQNCIIVELSWLKEELINKQIQLRSIISPPSNLKSSEKVESIHETMENVKEREKNKGKTTWDKAAKTTMTANIALQSQQQTDSGVIWKQYKCLPKRKQIILPHAMVIYDPCIHVNVFSQEPITVVSSSWLLIVE